MKLIYKGLKSKSGLKPFIKGGLKSGFKPSQKGLKSKGLKPFGAWPHAWMACRPTLKKLSTVGRITLVLCKMSRQAVNIPCNLSEKKITAIRCSTMTVALKFITYVVVGIKLENSKADAGISRYNDFLARNIAEPHDILHK